MSVQSSRVTGDQRGVETKGEQRGVETKEEQSLVSRQKKNKGGVGKGRKRDEVGGMDGSYGRYCALQFHVNKMERAAKDVC